MYGMKHFTFGYVFQLFPILIILLCSSQLSAQSDFLYTKSFSKKIKKFNLEFFQPVERWMKVSPVKEDKYLNYDVVLHSPPNVEVRILIKKDHRRLFPNVEIATLIAHISTNDDDAVIEFTQYPSRYALDHYGADLALYADFEPKESFSSYPRGRILILYKEGEALVNYIILYEGQLDQYFKMPLKFRRETY